MSGVRASNAQREQIVGELNRALVDGRLNLAEFEERSMAASYATWAGELPRFTEDLPRRATDGQRAYVVERLSQAAGQGYLQFPEFEERSAAVGGVIWAEELPRFTTDLPRSFRFVPQAEEPARASGRNPYLEVALGAVRRYPMRTAIASLAAVATGIIAVSVSSGHGSAQPEALAAVPPAPAMSTSATPAPTPTTPATPGPSPTEPSETTPSETTPSGTTLASSSAVPAAPATLTITCQTGTSGESIMYTSLKQAWAQKGGAYLCETDVPDGYKMTSLQKAAVAIDQRVDNGDSTTDSLGVITGFCAETVDLDTAELQPEPFDLGHFEDFEVNRLQAVYKLCPGAPTAHLMREAIFDLRTS